MGVYLIKSLKWTNHEPTNPNGETIWWGPNSSGYTSDITQAGIYTEKEIKEHRKHHRDTLTEIVPIEEKVWQEERIRAYKTYLEQDQINLERWERELERAKKAVKTAEASIDRCRKSIKKTSMQLKIQEKLKEHEV